MNISYDTLESMKVKELKELSKKLSMKGTSRYTKPDYIDSIWEVIESKKQKKAKTPPIDKLYDELQKCHEKHLINKNEYNKLLNVHNELVKTHNEILDNYVETVLKLKNLELKMNKLGIRL